MDFQYTPGRAGLRSFISCLALMLGLLLVAPASGQANPITDENALPGTAGWEVSQADTPGIDGYTNKTSIAPGESLGFSVSTSPSANYRIRIFRLGWYNGAGARLIGCLGSSFQAAPTCTTTSTGSARTTPNPNAQTGLIDASNNPAGGSWPVTNTLSAANTAGWTTGTYVAEYTLTSGGQAGFARYSPFVVRSNAPLTSASSILVVVPFNTYLAYNIWGGTSAYENTTSQSGPFPPSVHDHAYKLSFNRPFHRREWRFWDINLLRFLEKEGYDVSYVSDTDVDANPNILQQHRAVIVSGHAEYWTQNQRNGFDAARDAGTNIFFAGANDAYWQVRFEDSSCADDNTVCGTVGDRRTMVIYKGPNEGPDDPMPGTANDTSKFRELGRPECELQGGVQYGSWFPNDGYRDYTTTVDGAADPWATGTGLGSGSTVTGLVGFEFDSFFPDCNVPGTPKILFTYQGPETTAVHDSAAVKYTANGSGARVFSSGTEQWVWGLDAYRWDPALFSGIPTSAAITQFTRNILSDEQKPAAPAGVTANRSGNSIVIDTTPRTDPRITGYKVYRHAGTGAFQPGDPGVTLVCQNASGDCTDTPTPGTYRYASVAVDQWADSAVALSASVDNLNPPTAVNDSATVSEDSGATAISVLSNDTDPDGDPITISSASDPTHGTVVLTGGSPGLHTGLTYQPDAQYCNNPPGTSLDTFTYTINGGSTATVSMTVTCVDDSPVAVHDSKSVIEDDPATAVDVLANDTDIDGGPKTVQSVTQPAHGQVVITGGGTGLTYQPNANYCNFPGGLPSDDFNYTLNGGSTNSVSMTVDCRDDPPVANDDTKTVTEDANATAVDVLANDTDAEGNAITINGATDPANGTVVLTGGTPGAHTGLTYKPDANYCNNPPTIPADTFNYTVNGGDTATVSVTVTCVNDLPIAVNDSATVSEDAASTVIPVLANDPDPENDPRTISSASDPANGTVTLSGGSPGARTTLAYQPDPNYCNNPPGSSLDTFTYTINGGSTATVSVTVSCVDDAPVAHPDAGSVNEDAAATAVPVLTNDTDVDAGPKTINSVTQPTNGTVVITGGGTGLTYQPNANYCNNNGGTADKFNYTLNGGSTAQVSMTVFCFNDQPVAVHDSKSVLEDDPATAVDVLANDTDAEGDAITISSVTQPANGQVVITGGGTGLTYKPNANYCNFPGGLPSDDFNYTVNGGSTTSVSMTVDCVNDPPVANNDSRTVNEDASAAGVTVLSNDTDVEGDAITIVSATDPANGTVAITGGGTGLTYQPDANYCNNPPGSSPDTFTYTVNGNSPSKTATVSMTVNCVDDLPVAVQDSKSVTEDDPATAVDVLANDTDPDGGTKSIASVTQPTHGQAVITGGGTGLTYKPNANYCNFPSGSSDNFTYTLNGGSTATVSMTVDCVNDAPAANDDSKTVAEDANATAVDVLANDTDVEGDSIAIIDRTQATHGNVVITGGGTGLTYRPTADYCGPDSFTYTVNGGDTATVSVTVNCADDPPTAVNDSKTISGNSNATAVDVLANDTDIDAGPMTVTAKTNGTHGAVAITGGGTGLTYDPDTGYCGPDSFSYTLNGGSSATVSITVDCSGAPTAVDDSPSVAEDATAAAINVLANDTDADGGAPITIISKTDPANGTVQITGGGTGLTYTPNANYCNNPPGSNPDTFTYTVNGGDTATVSVTVNCADDPPVAVDDPGNAVSGNSGPNTINVLGNDTDIDGGPKTIDSTLAQAPAHGTVVVAGNGLSLTYQPNNGYCGADSFDYKLVPGGDSATVSVTVDCSTPPTAVNDSDTVNEDASATAVNVLSNDTDPDGGSKNIQSATDPAHGTVVVTGGGSGLTYEPDDNYCNTPSDPKDTFSYTLNGGSNATVSMTVTCVDDLPTASGDSTNITEDTGATAIAVLSNDNDVDGGPKSIDSVTQGTHGTVTITGGGSGLTYDLDDDYCNNPSGPPASPTDSFTYDLNGGSTGTVSVTIICVDDVPDAVDDQGNTVPGNSGANAIPVRANDTDIDGGPKTVTAKTNGAHGTVVITGGGTGLTYDPDTGYCGPDSFSYTLNGGDTATVSVAVDCSTPPTAVNDNGTVAQNAAATAVNVLGNDTDPDGGPTVIETIGDPAHGTVTGTGGTAGSWTGLTYQPDAGYCNTPSGPTDNFTYTVNGGSTATVFMTVSCPAVTPPLTTTTTPVNPPVTKCKKGFKKVKGKCKKKKRKRR
jgi:N,N-dimethylformamidase beta subunit-like, C-terminal/Bacterial Ig domain/Bacterial cadherin-like domain